MSGHHRASPNPPSRAGRTPARPRQEWPKDAVLDRLDIEHEYELMGVRFGGREGPKGWRPCYSKARDERKPSASVNVETGHYRDHAAEGGESLTFWDFAIRYGNVGSDFPSVIAHFAGKAGVKLQTAATIPAPKPRPKPQPSPQPGTVGTVGILGTVGDGWEKPGRRRKDYPSADEAIGATGRGMKSKAVNLGWVYQSPDGSEAFRVVRYHDSDGKKSYRPFHRTPDGGWVCGDPPGPLPLYGLPDLAGPGWVFVFEGEKVRDIARDRLGLLATTSAHGAGSADKSDWSPLAGREVVIVPDAGKVGDGYAADVVKLLGQLVPRPSIRLLKLPDLAEGEDLEQWLERAPELWEPERCRQEIERLAMLSPDPTKPPPPTDEELGLIHLEGVEPKEVEWLWHNRIPLGKITLLAGEGGIGKTFLALDIAATISRGAGWADRPEEGTKPGDVIILTAEDDLDDTIVPRLIKAGADLRRVRALGTARLPDGRLSPFTLADIDRLDRVMDVTPEGRCILIDPVTAFLGRGIDDNKNAELRGLLSPLADFAARRRVAILCITHFNKNTSPKAASRVIGSVAYSNAARATWCVVMDPEKEGRRLMLPVKNNLSPDQSGMAYTLENGVVRWEPDPIAESVNEILAGDSQAKVVRKERAIEIIRKVLAAGPLPSTVAKERIAAEGVGKNTAWKHKDEAGVIAFREDFRGPWMWRLANHPQASPSVPKDAQQSPTVSNGAHLFQASPDEGEIPGPRPMPEDFKPEVCGRCKQPFGPRGYHAAWYGDEPVAECWDCVEKMGA